MASKRIVFSTFGSLGDLHPCMALGLELQHRGHRVVIATSDLHRTRVEGAGIGFHPVRPHFSDVDASMVQELMDSQKGPERLLRGVVFPSVRESYDDLQAGVEGADLLVTSELSYAGRILAEQRGLPWLATILAPLSFFSVYDPPLLPRLPTALAPFRRLGPLVNRGVLGLVRRATRSWSEPVRQLRAELGLPPGGDPIYRGVFSPYGTLALFSPLIGSPQPDWPPRTMATGFVFYDRGEDGAGLDDELRCFLESGSPPIVFTLGSAAVYDPRTFYVESIAAAGRLGRRAVLLVGNAPRNLPRQPLPDGVAAFPYAPYSELFPRAAAIVHQGGIGTTAQALRAGRPMLVMPYSFDQPDNADRVVRLGVARTISRERYRAERVAAELRHLLEDARYAERAERVGEQIRAEDGVTTACDAIEAQLT